MLMGNCGFGMMRLGLLGLVLLVSPLVAHLDPIARLRLPDAGIGPRT